MHINHTRCAGLKEERCCFSGSGLTVILLFSGKIYTVVISYDADCFACLISYENWALQYFVQVPCYDSEVLKNIQCSCIDG